MSTMYTLQPLCDVLCYNMFVHALYRCMLCGTMPFSSRGLSRCICPECV